jgi:hypothetical protein
MKRRGKIASSFDRASLLFFKSTDWAAPRGNASGHAFRAVAFRHALVTPPWTQLLAKSPAVTFKPGS